MPVGPEVASDRDDVDAKTADLGLSEERSGYLVAFPPHFSLVKLVHNNLKKFKVEVITI